MWQYILDTFKDQAGIISASGAIIMVTLIFKNPIILIFRGMVRKFLGLDFKHNIYVRNNNKKYLCPSCFDDKIKLVHLVKLNDNCVKCPLCKETYSIES